MSTGEDPREHAIRTEARLEKAAQVERDRRAAWSDIEADGRRVEDNTARLKALRIAKEQADAATRAAEAAAKPVPKKRKPATRS